MGKGISGCRPNCLINFKKLIICAEDNFYCFYATAEECLSD